MKNIIIVVKPNILKDAERPSIIAKNPSHTFANKKKYTRKAKYKMEWA